MYWILRPCVTFLEQKNQLSFFCLQLSLWAYFRRSWKSWPYLSKQWFLQALCLCLWNKCYHLTTSTNHLLYFTARPSLRSGFYTSSSYFCCGYERFQVKLGLTSPDMQYKQNELIDFSFQFLSVFAPKHCLTRVADTKCRTHLSSYMSVFYPKTLPELSVERLFFD